jgi:dCMP deaminase
MANKSDIDSAFMETAKVFAKLSYARRLKVGAVLVKDERIISIGRNGTPSGRDNNCEVLSEGKLVTKREVLHAESNCISFAAKHGVSTDGCTIYITHSPCFECAKIIVQSGIKEVYYDVDYRDLSSVDFIRQCGIGVNKL